MGIYAHLLYTVYPNVKILNAWHAEAHISKGPQCRCYGENGGYTCNDIYFSVDPMHITMALLIDVPCSCITCMWTIVLHVSLSGIITHVRKYVLFLNSYIYISSYIVMCITKERTSLCVVCTCGVGGWGWGSKMTSSNGNIFRITGPLCGEFTSDQWIPLTKAIVLELWCFLWSVPE